MADTVRKSISLDARTSKLISEYAADKNLSFSGAVVELCSAALAQGADGPIAPRVTEIVVSEGEYLLHRIDDRIGFMLDCIREDMRKEIAELADD